MSGDAQMNFTYSESTLYKYGPDKQSYSETDCQNTTNLHDQEIDNQAIETDSQPKVSLFFVILSNSQVIKGTQHSITILVHRFLMVVETRCLLGLDYIHYVYILHAQSALSIKNDDIMDHSCK